MKFLDKIKQNVKHFYWTKKRRETVKRTLWQQIWEDAQKIFAKANERLFNLRSKHYHTSAMDDVANALGSDTRNFGEYTKKPTKAQLVEDMFEARKFQNSYYSTEAGALYEQTRMLSKEWEGAFGKGWYEKYGVTYDKSRIDTDKAKIAFAVFREIENEAAGLLYFNNKSFYDSATVIEMIYEIVEENLHPYIDLRNRGDHEYDYFFDEVIAKTRQMLHYQRSLLDPTEDPNFTREFIDAEMITGRYRRM